MSNALADNMILCYDRSQRGDHVKISLQIDGAYEDTEILIRSPKLTPELEQMDKVNSSWSWGRDLMQNLINGITYMLGSLINTVADVARSIWEYLHFSVPEKGALTDVEEWMPDFMKGLAKGINKSKKYVEAAVSGVADAMTLTMQSGLNVDMDGISGAMMNGGSGGVVNNYYNNDNSRTVNQTNNSPKSLSRLEIYRMTRNALNV